MKKSFFASRQKVLGSRPLVVGTLTNALSISSQLKKAKAARIDAIELRLDTFPRAYGAFQRAYDFGRNVVREIKTSTRLPILLTFRSSDEAGPSSARKTISDKNRSEILSRLFPAVELVDVEIRRRDFARRMTAIARVHGVDVIHSVHDFRGPGQLRTLAAFALASHALNGDAFKVAVTPKTNDDVEDFLKWGAGLGNSLKILIAMGAVGEISRVVAYSFGSVLTYGHLGERAAPGQMAAGALVRSVHNVYRGH